MRRFAALVALAAALFVGDAELQAVTDGPSGHPRIAPDLVVTRVEFGTLDEKGRFVPTVDIDASQKLSFGWRVYFEGTRRTVKFRERFVLPSPAAQWGVTSSTRVAPDGASAVTEEVVPLGAEMMLEHFWVPSPGDPKGRHSISVAVEQAPVADFHFTIR